MLNIKFILNPTPLKLFIFLFNRHSLSHLKLPIMKLYFLLHLIHFLIHASIPPLIFFKYIKMLTLNLQAVLLSFKILHITLLPLLLDILDILKFLPLIFNPFTIK